MNEELQNRINQALSRKGSGKPAPPTAPSTNKGGRPRKDIPIEGIKINEEVHILCQELALLASNTANRNISMVDICSELVMAFSRKKEMEMIALIPKIVPRGEPWKFVYVTEEARRQLNQICIFFNQNIPLEQLKKLKLKHKVNASNLLSALIVQDCQQKRIY